jgi:hypothetical protein
MNSARLDTWRRASTGHCWDSTSLGEGDCWQRVGVLHELRHSREKETTKRSELRGEILMARAREIDLGE